MGPAKISQLPLDLHTGGSGCAVGKIEDAEIIVVYLTAYAVAIIYLHRVENIVDFLALKNSLKCRHVLHTLQHILSLLKSLTDQSKCYFAHSMGTLPQTVFFAYM